MASCVETLAPTFRSAAPVISFEEAERLAAEYGSPLLVYSRSALVRNYEIMRNGLPGVEFFYAAKANPSQFLLAPLAELGCSVDVCSHREALAALEAGFAPDMMLHTHPCKTISNLVDCYGEGIRWFVYDTAAELEKFVQHTPDVNLLLRLAVSSTSSNINLSAKFGAFLDEALPLLLEAQRLGLAVRGVSFHVGSQCLSPSDFDTALAQVRVLWNAAAAAGVPLEVLDIGGGFPAPYRNQVLTLESYCRSLSESLETNFGDLPIRIIAEPGRGMCADTVTLITRVIGKSVRRGMPWYIIDDGLYGSFSGIVFDHVEFPLIAADAEERPLGPCVIAGPTCDSSDVVARDQLLPDLEVGELILVPSMGAYTSASASAFNGLDIARAIGVE